MTNQALALRRAVILLRAAPPTIREVMDAGNDAIEAAGLNPWCMNEGLASGDEEISLWAFEEAVRNAEREVTK